MSTPTNPLKPFAERLNLLKRERNLLQKDIASGTGIALRSYQYYEKGQRLPDIDTLTKLCDYFDVSSEYLLGYTDDPKGMWTEGLFTAANETVRKIKEKSEISDAELFIIKKLRALPPEKRKAIEMLLD